MTVERAIIKLGLTTWCRQFARKVSVYDSLDRLATASERMAGILNISLNKHLIIL